MPDLNLLLDLENIRPYDLFSYSADEKFSQAAEWLIDAIGIPGQREVIRRNLRPLIIELTSLHEDGFEDYLVISRNGNRWSFPRGLVNPNGYLTQPL